MVGNLALHTHPANGRRSRPIAGQPSRATVGGGGTALEAGNILNVGGLCQCGNVELTARMIEEIPRGNLRVPRSEFASVWAEAERLCDEEKRGGPGGGWYAAGVACTCRWIAGASVVFNFPHGPRTQPASAPITGRTARAHEELIEAETVAAEGAALESASVFDDRPGWVGSIAATFAWAWRGSGVPPLLVRRAEAG